ncbi:MAG: hypothetical protein ACI4WT_09985 [Oligosphaeraceae bacterium]
MGKVSEFYVQVPLSACGLYAFHDTMGLDDVRTFVFSTDEILFLMKLFTRFSREFDLLIETHEEETLDATHLDRALELTEEFAKENASGQFSSAVEHFKEALLLAKQCQMPLIFDF